MEKSKHNKTRRATLRDHGESKVKSDLGDRIGKFAIAHQRAATASVLIAAAAALVALYAAARTRMGAFPCGMDFLAAAVLVAFLLMLRWQLHYVLFISRTISQDRLTGTLNSAAFMSRMEELVSNPANRCALFMIDIDEFKSINDTYGHPVGDGIIRAVAARLRHVVRAGDLISRLGGDEFAVLLVNVAGYRFTDGFLSRLNRVMSEPIDVDGRKISCKLSVGFASSPLDAISAKELYRAADASMYAQKKAHQKAAVQAQVTAGTEVKKSRG